MSKTVLKGPTDRATSADDSMTASNVTVVLTGEGAGEGGCPSDQPRTNTCEEAIRTLAHSKWEAAGCPTGDGIEFWLEAEREVNAESASGDPT